MGAEDELKSEVAERSRESGVRCGRGSVCQEMKHWEVIPICVCVCCGFYERKTISASFGSLLQEFEPTCTHGPTICADVGWICGKGKKHMQANSTGSDMVYFFRKDSRTRFLIKSEGCSSSHVPSYIYTWFGRVHVKVMVFTVIFSLVRHLSLIALSGSQQGN